jgi:hypothetical protein
MTNTKSDIKNYVEQAAKLIDLPLAPEHRPGVEENFAKIAEIAKLVTDFPIPKTIEPAYIFEP